MHPKPKMLIVDDEPNVLESLCQLFDLEFHVLTASDGQMALSLLQHHPEVAIVISDQRMPGMSGVELLKHVKQLVPNTMRILLTGYADLEAVLDSVNVGEVFRYVRKPWVAETLKSIVALAMASYMLRCQKEHRNKQKHGTVLQSPPTPLQPVPQRRRTDPGFVPPPNQVLPPIPDPLPQRRATDKGFSSFEEEFLAHQAPDESLKPPQVERVFESFEEEFFASFREEAISELKKFESFEEEFFARLNSRLAQLESPLTSLKPFHTLEPQPSEIFNKVFYGRSGKPKILIVDDEVRVLSALSELLSSDYDVLTCTSADAALDILENSAFVACILTDMRMPHKSGSDFLRESQSLAPIVPKILMTAFSDVEHITSLINQGLLFRHIEKPWDISKLSASLQEAVEACRQNVERGLKVRCETVSRYSF